MMRPLLLGAAVLYLNQLSAVDQPVVTCDFNTVNKADSLPPYLSLDNSGNQPSTVSIIPDSEASGNSVGRVTLQPGQDRQEFVIMRPGGPNGTLRPEIGDDLWVGFRMRISNLLDPRIGGSSPSLFQLGPVRNTISWEQGAGLFQVQLSRSRGLLTLRTFRSSDGSVPRFPADSTYPPFLDFLPEPQDRWVALTCQVRLRDNADGRLRIWADGNLVVDLRGPNTLPGDTMQVKWGVYIGGGNSMADSLSADYDDIAMTDEPVAEDGFRIVSPAVSTPYRSGVAFQKTLVPPSSLVTTGLSWATSPLPTGLRFNSTSKSLVGTLPSSAHGRRIAWWLADSSGVRRYQQVLRLTDLNASPSVPTVATPAAPTANSLTSATPRLSGITAVYATVKIYDNTTLLGNVMASPSGAWAWTVSPPLAQGSHSLRIMVTDDRNITSAFSPVTTITVPDTTAPTRPPAPITSSKTSATPTLSGITESNATVKIYANDILLRTVTANGSGAWSWTVTPALAQGSHVIKITATDGANNTSYGSLTTTMNVPDRTPPVTPAAPTASSLTSATPVLSGTTEANATVRVYDHTLLLTTVTATSTGTWSWLASPALSQGTHELKITATDPARNTSAVSPPRIITVADTTSPATPSAPTASSRTSANPLLYGTTEANATIKISSGATLLSSVTASSTGAWSWKVSPSLAVGTHAITVMATDAANNTSAPSAATTITVAPGTVVDVTPPSKPPAPTVSSATSMTPMVSGNAEANSVISLFDNGLLIRAIAVSSSGTWSWTVNPAFSVGTHALTVLATDDAGNSSPVSSATMVTARDTTPPATPGTPNANSGADDTPTLSGTTEANATVTIYDDTRQLHTLTASSVGTWSWTVTPALAPGVHPVTVTATDLASNVSGRSPARTITVPDITPPAQPPRPSANSLTSSTPMLSGTAEANATVKIYVNATLLTSVTATAGGTWSWTVTPALAQGSHTVYVTATDAGGNVSAMSSAITISVPDTTPPAIPVAPVVNSAVDDTPTLSGTTEANATVTIYNGATPLYMVIANSTGSWSWTVAPALAQGTHVLTVTATDLARNVSGRSPATTVTVPDTTPPAAPAAPIASSLISATPVLSGTTEANATVKIYNNATLLNTVTASATGTWSWTVSPALIQGRHGLKITATDGSNNTSGFSAVTTVTVPDTTSPATPAAPTASSLTSGNPVLSGTTEANARIKIFSGTALLKTVTASPTGAWTWTVTPSLTVGTHAITVIATDVANNASAVSPATTIAVTPVVVADTTPPLRPSAPTVSSATSSTPVVSGTTEAGATISLFDNALLIKTIAVASSGSWSWTVNPAFAVGSHALTVMATDGAGNASAVSLATTVTVSDTTPPATPTSPTVNSATDDTPTLSGTTEANATVTIYNGATRLNSVTANNVGTWNWTVTPALTQGVHLITVTATDQANNVSGRSPATTITVPDITPPTKPATPTASSLTSSTPTLSGTTEANATVKIYDNTTLLNSVTAATGGAWSWTVTPALAQGSHALHVTATDAAGNTSAASSSITIAVPDTTPPPTPAAPTASSVTSSTPALSGTTEANAMVNIYDNTTLLKTVTASTTGGWTWTVTPALAQGAHSLKITATDGSNNTSAFSPVTIITVPDTTPPATPTAPTTSSLASATPVLSGTTESNAKVKIYDHTTLLQTVTASASGAWTWTVTPALAQGSHPLKITATDGSNNTSGFSAVTTVTVPDTTPPATPVAPTASSLTTAAPVLSGSTEANARVKIYDNTTLLTTVTVSATGAWTWTVTPALVQGSHLLKITATDVANNTSGFSAVTTVTVPDTTPPVTPAAPTASSLTSGNPLLSGTTEANARIKIFAGTTLLRTVTASPTGVWTWTVTPSLAVGTHAITVIATDAANNASVASPATTITVTSVMVADTTPPTRPSAPTVSSATSSTPVVSGNTEAGATISLFDNALLIETIAVTTSGSWSWTVNPPFDVGYHALTVMATDGAGNASEVSLATTVTVSDTTPPDTPSAPNVNSLTDDTPTLSGTTETNATVTIYNGATRLNSVTANSVGMWSWTVAPALMQGIHLVTVTSTDVAGNISESSPEITITVPDITPPTKPATPTVSSLTSATPTLSGTTEAYATVLISDGDGVTEMVTATGTGTWTWTPSEPLAEGVHRLTIAAQDAASNISPLSDAVVITVLDGTPPLTPPAPIADSSISANPTLRGISEANATMQIRINGILVKLLLADESGVWSWTVDPTLAHGVHVVTVTAIDRAGNISASSPETSLNVRDTTAPSIPVIATIVDGATGRPTLSGLAETLATVIIRSGETTLGTTTVHADGQWSWTVTPALSEGMHLLSVVAQDAAGNQSDASIASAVSVADTTPPAVPAAPLVSQGASPRPTFSGSTEPGARMTVYDDSHPVASVTAGSDGTWSLTIDSELSPGPHSITVTAQDGAGNTSAASPSITITVDEFIPGRPRAPTPNATGVTTVSPTLAGVSDPETRIRILNGSTQIGSVTANSTGQWQWTPPTPLTVGTHALTIVEVDALGRVSSPSEAVVVRVAPPSDTAPVATPVADGGARGGCGVGGSVAILLGGLVMLGGRRRIPKGCIRW